MWQNQQMQMQQQMFQQQQMQQQQQMHMMQMQMQQQQQVDPSQLPIGPGGELIERMANAITNRLHNMKQSYSLFQEFVKMMVQYHQAAMTMSTAGKHAGSILSKISTGQGQPDLREGFKVLSELQSSVDGRLQNVSHVLFNELIKPAQNVLTGGYRETLRFEEGFLRGFAKVKTELYQVGMSGMRTAKLQEVEDKVANNLQILKGLERKVYTNFLLLYSAFLDSICNHYKLSGKSFVDKQQLWSDLAVSGSNIAKEPVEFKELIAQQRGQVPQTLNFPSTPDSDHLGGSKSGPGPSVSPRGPPPAKGGPGATADTGSGAGGGLQAVQAPDGSFLLVSDWSAKGTIVPRVVGAGGMKPKSASALREEVQQQYKAMPKLGSEAESTADQWNIATPVAPMLPEFMAKVKPAVGAGGPAGAPAASRASSARSGGSVEIGADGKYPKYKALYAYTANQPDELSFPAGATLVVVSKDSPNWWCAIYQGKTNLVPANYLQQQ